MTTRKPTRAGLTLKQQAYVETISDMERQHGHAHVSGLARDMGVSKPSVVQMLDRLGSAGVVRKEAKEIMLSAAGLRIARALGDSQALLQDFMIHELGMNRKTAAEDACRMEHVVSPAFVQSLRRHRTRDRRQ
ncbi:MAG: metal-dependent transcriptional regulator [Lentisphaerae bacterium]|nr:metal-dependent transcriptional regulator [Lentisphaerota bacterium]